MIFHDPIRVADMPDRKKLAQASWQAVHDGVVSRLPHHRHGHEDVYRDREL